MSVESEKEVVIKPVQVAQLGLSSRTMSLINKARKSNQPKASEKEVSISALLNSSASSKQASPQKSPVAVTPAEPVESSMPPPKKQLPIIGNQTIQLLQKLRKKGTCQQDPQTRLHDLLDSQ